MLPEDRPEGPSRVPGQSSIFDQAAWRRATKYRLRFGQRGQPRESPCSTSARHRVLTQLVGGFSTVRVAARTFLAVLRIAVRA